MLNTPPDNIWLNGREVSVEFILADKVKPQSSFEKDILSFSHKWLKGSKFFNFQSSGSTGVPKQIQINRSRILDSILMTSKALGLRQDERALLCIPVANTGGKMMLARAFEIGLVLECVEPTKNPIDSATFCPDFMAVVPLQLSEMVANSRSRKLLSKCRNVIVGGAPVDDKLIVEIQNVPSRIYATYGMTETVSHIALKLLNTPDRQQYYQILPGIEIEVDTHDCLKVKGAVTDHEWIQTNDRVKIIDENHFDWIGRSDLVINSGGHKIQPENVEKKIIKIFGAVGISRSFFIHGLPDQKLGTKCTLLVEGEPLEPSIEQKLKAHLDMNFRSYEKPRAIEYVGKFVTTASGKLDRQSTANLTN